MKFAASYEFFNDGWSFLTRGTVNFSYDHLMVDYREFRNLVAGGPVGEEPLYELRANIFQLFFSFWY